MAEGYRTLDALIEERIAGFRARRLEQRMADDAVRRVFAQRKARIAAGKAGTGVALCLFLGSLGFVGRAGRDRGAMNTYILAAAWGALAIAGLLAWGLAQRRARRHLRREPAVTGDAHADLARIEVADPLADLRLAGSMLEARSTTLPLAAASLLLPLTLHGLVATVVGWATGTRWTAADFGCWIAASTFLVGLAHLALLVQVVLWAHSLPQRDTSQLRQNIHATWARTLGVTTGVALVPAVGFAADGNLLVLLPAVLVLATGAAFVPLLFLLTARRLEKERAVLSPQLQPIELPQLRHL
jgi:hypothetical protein